MPMREGDETTAGDGVGSAAAASDCDAAAALPPAAGNAGGDAGPDPSAGPAAGIDMDAGIDIEALSEAYERGLAREKAGDLAGAVEAFCRALALDPYDRGGVSLRLAALGAAAAPRRAPPAYVTMLFDQHAEQFDRVLVGDLGYDVPAALRAAAEALGILPVGRMLDLGCGTGLAGLAFAGRYGHLTGVDLSPGMLGEADGRGGYDDLYVGEATGFLASWAEDGEPPFELIVATDVVPYLGALGGLFRGAAACLAPEGHFGFSTETLPPEAMAGRNWAVGPGTRFAHAPDYLRARLSAAGLSLCEMTEVTVRMQDGVPVPGHLVVARRDP